MALFVATSALWLCLVSPGFDACRRAFGRDFLAFYAAGTMVREGRGADLYDLDAIRRVEQHVARSAGYELDAIAPWWNPPPCAWLFAPLSVLPYTTALTIWTATNLAAGAGAAYLLGRLAAPHSRPDRALLALLVLASPPFLQSIVHGQNGAISLLLVTVAVTAWRSGKLFLASACLGLLLYKPQLAAALAVVLVLHRGWRAGAGLAYVGCVLLALTAQTLPGSLPDYIHRLPHNLHAIQVEQTYLWERHVTLKAFWRLLLQGRGPGETSWLVTTLTVLTALPLALGLFVAARRTKKTMGGMGKAEPYPWPGLSNVDKESAPPTAPDRLVAAAVACTPLLMPFYFDYDLLLLVVAAALTTNLSRRAMVLWSALYVWLFVNPYVAGAVRFNLTVPLLWCVAVHLVDRALHGEQRNRLVETVTDAPAPLAAAA